MEGVVIVRTGGEIGIKSSPVRRIYEHQLLKTIRKELHNSGINYSKLSRIAGRIYIETGDSEKAAQLAAKNFGISSASPGIRTESNLGEIIDYGVKFAKNLMVPGTFAVQCRRIGSHPFTSQQVASELGKALLGLGLGLKVDLDNPQQVLNVEIRDSTTIIYSKTFRGPDGFPIGTQEIVVGIIDDTSDSVTASWCMMKRGCQLRAFVLSGPDGPTVQVMKNLKALANWVPERIIKTTAVPMRDIADPETSMLKLQLAAKLASRRGIEGVVSGLRLRTHKDLAMTICLPTYVFMPLIAMDDELIESWQKLIGHDPPDHNSHKKIDSLGSAAPGSKICSILSKAEEMRIRADL